MTSRSSSIKSPKSPKCLSPKTASPRSLGARLELPKLALYIFLIFVFCFLGTSFRLHLYVCVPDDAPAIWEPVLQLNQDFSKSVFLPVPGEGIVGHESKGEEIRRALFSMPKSSETPLKEDTDFPRLNSSLMYYRELAMQTNTSVFAAVCITGIPRSAALTFANQKQQFYSRMPSYTTFVYAPPDMHFYEAFLYRPAVISVQPQENITLTVKGRFSKNEHRLQGWMQQLYSLYQCNEMRKRYEQQNNVHFTWLVRARFDLWFKQPLTNLEKLSRSHVHVPSEYGGEHGLNDRFAFIPRKHMDVYAGQFLEIEWYRGRVTPEVFLKDHLSKHKAQTQLHESWHIGLMREHGETEF